MDGSIHRVAKVFITRSRHLTATGSWVRDIIVATDDGQEFRITLYGNAQENLVPAVLKGDYYAAARVIDSGE